MFDRVTDLFDDDDTGEADDAGGADTDRAVPDPVVVAAGSADGTLDLGAQSADGEGGSEAVEAPTVSAPDASILAKLATTLAETWPEYDLDRSPASLARLDDLLETEFDDPPSQTEAFGAYVGEVFVENYDATWVEDDDAGWVVALADADQRWIVPIPLVLRDCLTGEATFAATHDAVLDETGRSGPGGAGDANDAE